MIYLHYIIFCIYILKRSGNYYNLSIKDDKTKYVCVWIMNINKENTIKSGDNFVLIIYYYQSLTIVLLNSK